MSALPPLTLYLAAPRGFCAGVDRAIKIVEMALEKWGAPVYVRHEIVHNKYVVDGLRAKGAVFVEELEDCPPDRPVIFSAHGVPKSVPQEAQARQMLYVDATCPLVSKVHIEAERHHANGLQMVMIGHAGHPETIGTMGQLPEGEVLLVEAPADVAGLFVRDPAKLAYITQTTLSVDDTAEVVAALKARFPAIIGPHKEDICYATTNRQEAVKAMAPKADRVWHCDFMLHVRCSLGLCGAGDGGKALAWLWSVGLARTLGVFLCGRRGATGAQRADHRLCAAAAAGFAIHPLGPCAKMVDVLAPDADIRGGGGPVLGAMVGLAPLLESLFHDPLFHALFRQFL